MFWGKVLPVNPAKLVGKVLLPRTLSTATNLVDEIYKWSLRVTVHWIGTDESEVCRRLLDMPRQWNMVKSYRIFGMRQSHVKGNPFKADSMCIVVYGPHLMHMINQAFIFST